MSCEWESKVALLAGGDLPSPASAIRHLSECPSCRSLYEDLNGLREELQGPMPDLSIQQAVMERLRRPASPRWYWAAAAAAVLLLVALTAQRYRAVEQPMPPARSAVTATASAPAPSSRAAAIPIRGRKRSARSVQPPSEPAVVKLVTDDPNVVIYLVAD